jgi:hypothetical protein
MLNMLKLARITWVLGLVALPILGAAAIGAQTHPAYLHALSDLRDARAHLQRPNHGALQQQEQEAVSEIDKAIHEIKSASIDDGKNIDDHVAVDDHLEWGGRLRRANELLGKAFSDIDKEEDNPEAHGLKRRSLEHINAARAHVREALELIH